MLYGIHDTTSMSTYNHINLQLKGPLSKETYSHDTPYFYEIF
jgi:hypothetical protein